MLTDKEIEEGIAHLEHGFMGPQIWREHGAVVPDPHCPGETITVPASEWEADPNPPAVDKTPKAYWAMLSAPGYMDRTDAAGPFKTEREAAEYLVETYADDIDDCPDCSEEE